MLPFYNLTSNQPMDFIESNNNIRSCLFNLQYGNKKMVLSDQPAGLQFIRNVLNLKLQNFSALKHNGQKNWEYLSCQKIKFPFVALSNHEIKKKIFFNANAKLYFQQIFQTISMFLFIAFMSLSSNVEIILLFLLIRN